CTTHQQDFAIRQELENEIGTSHIYSMFAYNCRHWSQGRFKKIQEDYGLEICPAPPRGADLIDPNLSRDAPIVGGGTSFLTSRSTTVTSGRYGRFPMGPAPLALRPLANPRVLLWVLAGLLAGSLTTSTSATTSNDGPR